MIRIGCLGFGLGKGASPLEKWGVLPYFNFRSEAEQASINQHALAS